MQQTLYSKPEPCHQHMSNTHGYKLKVNEELKKTPTFSRFLVECNILDISQAPDNTRVQRNTM